MGSSSTIDRESVKETIEYLFFQLDHQQEIVDRYGDMEIALDRQIARNRHLEERDRELGASAFSFFNFVQSEYDTLRKKLEDESRLTAEFREEMGNFQNKIQEQDAGIDDQTSEIADLKKQLLQATQARHIAQKYVTASAPGFSSKWMKLEIAWLLNVKIYRIDSTEC